jgi:hypothetical protein
MVFFSVNPVRKKKFLEIFLFCSNIDQDKVIFHSFFTYKRILLIRREYLKIKFVLYPLFDFFRILGQKYSIVYSETALNVLKRTRR